MASGKKKSATVNVLQSGFGCLAWKFLRGLWKSGEWVHPAKKKTRNGTGVRPSGYGIGLQALLSLHFMSMSRPFVLGTAVKSF